MAADDNSADFYRAGRTDPFKVLGFETDVPHSTLREGCDTQPQREKLFANEVALFEFCRINQCVSTKGGTDSLRSFCCVTQVF